MGKYQKKSFPFVFLFFVFLFLPYLGSYDHFSIDAYFTDFRSSGVDFAVHVGLPDAPPLRFLPEGRWTTGPIEKMRTGETIHLDPTITFASAPRNDIDLSRNYPAIRSALQFRVQPGAGDPVLSVDEQGTVTGLRVGTGVVEVVFGSYVAPFAIRVRAPSPLDGALIFHAPDLTAKPRPDVTTSGGRVLVPGLRWLCNVGIPWHSVLTHAEPAAQSAR